MRYLILGFIMCLYSVAPGSDLIMNVNNRSSQSLNGDWKIIIDPYENGFYDYRYQEYSDGYFQDAKAKDKTDRIEYNFDTADQLSVPGDWNTQRDELFLYEGTIWYRKKFDYEKKNESRLFVYFGAANYEAIVYLNGKKLGKHVGGFTPFNFEITDHVKTKNNSLVVKVDNKRYREAVPTVNTDWWNYGGLTRQVLLVETPKTFIRDYFIQLEKGSTKEISGWIKLDGQSSNRNITLEIPEAKIKKSFSSDDNGLIQINFQVNLTLWTPENPKVYKIKISSESDTIIDKIGFRSIETRGADILLNGTPIFLRGICYHEEQPLNGSRAFSKEDARTILSWVKEMNGNFMRLAHYPHNEFMAQMADEMGILLWEEIPVYWTILWENQETLANAVNQLSEVINRDRNRASVILWSMANETPLSEPRLDFLINLAEHARHLDPTRLITAAMERHYEQDNKTLLIDDPFGKVVDVLGCNEYLGWYDGLPEKCKDVKWDCIYNKPLIMSEFGGGALFGLHGDSLTRWSEEFQEDIYTQQIQMLEKIPFLRGTTPWILKDFRSPRRPLADIQNFYNRKGLISERGERKKAFYVMQGWYKKLEENQQ